jgi:hypothetical protein
MKFQGARCFLNRDIDTSIEPRWKTTRPQLTARDVDPVLRLPILVDAK